MGRPLISGIIRPVATMTYRALWRWHFHAGLFCIPFVLILALSGSIYLFKPQIDALADRDVDSLQVTGQRASGEAQISAAIASLPGSKLFVYEIPREANDAVRVHLYGTDGAGRIVYVHPETLAILKSVPHTARLTEIVRMIHSELLVGKLGSLLIELAACWAIIMLGTGLYLWWPRETRGLGGVLYPRLGGLEIFVHGQHMDMPAFYAHRPLQCSKARLAQREVGIALGRQHLPGRHPVHYNIGNCIHTGACKREFSAVSNSPMMH